MNTILLAIAAVVVLAYGPWMILYWLPKWERVGVEKAARREEK